MPENFPFDVILFDIGGVLLTNGWDHAERALVLDHFQLDPDAFEQRHNATYPAWERSDITVEQYLEETVFYEPRPFAQQDFFAAILAQSKLLPDGAIEILKELTAGKARESRACLIGALNNEARETNDFRLAHFGLRPLFQVTLSSCYLGLRKPDPSIYRAALDILSRPPERILFIDDREENAAAAARTGMKATCFTGAAALRSELGSLGVL